MSVTKAEIEEAWQRIKAKVQPWILDNTKRKRFENSMKPKKDKSSEKGRLLVANFEKRLKRELEAEIERRAKPLIQITGMPEEVAGEMALYLIAGNMADRERLKKKQAQKTRKLTKEEQEAINERMLRYLEGW